MTQKRKGARRIADIPADILDQINQGEIETVNLVECLALDFAVLMQHAVPDMSDGAIAAMDSAADKGWLDRTRLASKLIYDDQGPAAIEKLLQHRSDNVRGWASGVVALIPDISLTERLALIQPLANDPNSATRETVWLLMREHIARDIKQSIQVLTPWVHHDIANIRRFATEATRPRGVWCSHIPALKANPALGLPLLEPLKADPVRYVQDSVANWLNDAAKSQPEWVTLLTDDWLQQSNTKATAYIYKRARRSL